MSAIAARLLRDGRVPDGWRGPAYCLGLGLLAALWWFMSGRAAGFEVSGRFRRAAVFNWTAVGFALPFPLALRFSPAGAGVRAVAEWISLRAYGLDLVHFSLLEPASRHLSPGWPSAAGPAAALGGSFLLADLSWRFVERSILLRRPPAAGLAAA